MTTLEGIVGLMAVLTFFNTVGVILLTRQVGVLHVRIKPMPALTGASGPEAGSFLTFGGKRMDLAALDLPAGSRKRIVAALVSPSCSICGPLLPGLESLAKSAKRDTEVVLMGEVDRDRMKDYLKRRGLEMAWRCAPDAFAANGVPGAPFAAVLSEPGRVLKSGSSHLRV